MGIWENEPAGTDTKLALNKPREKKFKIPYADLKRGIKNYIHQKWQKRWNNNTNNKLHSIKPILGEWRKSLRRITEEEIKLFRLGMGYTDLTYSELLKDQPICVINQDALHSEILNECTHQASVGHKFYEKK